MLRFRLHVVNGSLALFFTFPRGGAGLPGPSQLIVAATIPALRTVSGD
jgi:hypothetical protein